MLRNAACLSRVSAGAVLHGFAALTLCLVLLPGLLAAPALADGPGAIATDGYFDVERIDRETYAIREPRYWQRNVSYVLKGETRAILFDSGSGTRNIRFVAHSVTHNPMTVVASHLHYDHIGSHNQFEQVAMIDLPETRAATSDNWYSPPILTSLWPFAPGFHVTQWWKPGDAIDLGGRVIDVVHIPGHTGDSIALVDRARGYAFVGDHLFGGPLLANLPGSDLSAYLQSTRHLLRDFPEIRTVFGAHEKSRLPRASLEALEQTLLAIQEKRAPGESLWWTAWTSSRYPGEGFTVFAQP